MKRRLGVWLVISLTFVGGLKGEDRFFDSDGVKIHYVIEGKGEPVLLIHGFAANIGFQWTAARIIPALAKDYQVIAIDNRGHGQSDKPRDPAKYGMQMVEDQVRLLDHLKIERAHVVGYSMGAFITCKLVTTHPERVRSAVLGGAGAIRQDQAKDKIGVELAESLEQGKGIRPLLVELTPVGKPVPSEEQLQAINTMMKTVNDTKALAAVVRGFPGLIVDEEKLRENKVPTLGLIGDIDPLKQRTLDPLVGLMSNLKIEVVKGGDHMNAFLKPEFLADLKTFLAAHREQTAPVGVK